MIDWDDLRLFIAMAEEGSLSAASRKLNVSQPTLSRRLTALEEQLGTDLFARSVEGLIPTPTGTQLLEHALNMREDAISIERIATGEDRNLKGTVTISAMEVIGAEWLTNEMFAFSERYPDITINMNLGAAPADLLRREADIAVRMFQPEEPDLIAKKIGHIKYHFYAHERYVAKHGRPKTMAELNEHKLVFPNASMMLAMPKRARENLIADNNVAFTSGSMVALKNATERGYGIGMHSDFSAFRAPELVRIFDEPIMESDIYLVTHKDIQRNVRVRVAYDFIADLFKKLRDLGQD